MEMLPQQPNEKDMSDTEDGKDLEIYLRDHYAGAVGAIELLDHWKTGCAGKPLARFFTELHADVKADHEQLHNLMTALGFSESGVRNAGAWMAEKLGRAKLGFSGGEAAGLSLLQTLESLLLGITGKLALWRALSAAREASPILQRTDFDLLADRAVEQIERVEAQRLETARSVFQL
jgi:hypothetical protein